jgi:hypothetical protein
VHDAGLHIRARPNCSDTPSGNAGGATWDFMAYYESESGYTNSTDLNDTMVYTDDVWNWYHHITKFTVG